MEDIKGQLVCGVEVLTDRRTYWVRACKNGVMSSASFLASCALHASTERHHSYASSPKNTRTCGRVPSDHLILSLFEGGD